MLPSEHTERWNESRFETIYQGSTLFNRHLVTMPLIEPYMNTIVDRRLTLPFVPNLPFRTVSIFTPTWQRTTTTVRSYRSSFKSFFCMHILLPFMFAGFETFAWRSHNTHMTLSRPFGWLMRCNQTASFQINYSRTRTHSIFQTLSYAWHSIFFQCRSIMNVTYVIVWWQHMISYLSCMYGLSSSHLSNLWYCCTWFDIIVAYIV